MRSLISGLNLTVSFLLELVALVVFGVWGSQVGEGTLMKVILGLGAPLLMIVFWGAWMAPRSPRRLQDPWHLVFEILIFGAAVLALLHINRPDLGLILAVVIILNIGLSFPLHQRPTVPAD
jgi:hypothetical protein